MTWQAASFAILGVVLIGGFAWYERSRPPSQIVALVAALAALAVAGRLALAAVPNVVATTDIVIFSGYALGAAPGFVVGALAGLVSNFWLGQGPWTPWQMAGWGLCGVVGAILAVVTRRRAGRIELTAVCAVAGGLFGALLNFSLMVSYGGEFSLDRWLALEGRGVPFDLAHAIGNLTLAAIAGPAMVRMLIRFRERFEFRWGASESGRPRPGLAGAGAALLCLVAILAFSAGAGSARSPAAGWLLAARDRDGGFPATPGGGSSRQMTGWAMLGLEAAGENPLDAGRPSPVHYLRRNAADLRAATDLSLAILALRGAGVEVRHFAGRNLVAVLAAKRRRNGSYEGWPNATAFGVMALRSAGAGGRIGPSLAWLRRAQAADGGWGSVVGSASDPDSTGAVLQALQGSRGSRRAIRFLRRSQAGSGGWALAVGGPVNSQSTAWAVQGLLAAGIDPATVKRHGRSGLDYLAARRAGDGHYRYSSSSDQTPVWVTAQVIAAVNRKPFPLAPVPRARRGKPSSSPTAGSRGGSGGTGDAAVDGGGAGAPSEPFAPERATHSGDQSSGESSERRVKRGSGTAPTSQDNPAAPRPSTNAAFSNEDDDGDSPLVPILIGLGCAGLILGGTWYAARRYVW